jgi:hypothetical protein
MWRRHGDMVICCSKQEKHIRNCSLAAEESREEQGEINNYLLPTLQLACSKREGYQGEESDDYEEDQEKEHNSEVRGGGSGAGGELVVSR